jgi:DNA-binding response OmpR family regulator
MNLNQEAMSEKLIMIADNMDESLAVLSDILRNANYKVVTAKNGFEVILHKDFDKVDLVLMDLQMPYLNGIVTTDIIRKKLEMIEKPIIIGFSKLELTKKNVTDLGMNDFLYKTYNMQVILAKIRFWEEINQH